MDAFSLFSWKKNELVFVGVVLLVILVVSQIQLRVGQMKTRDAQRKADVELVGRALNKFYFDHQELPAAMNGKIVSCGDILDLACEWGEGWIRDQKGNVYLNKLPKDPLADAGRKYIYEVDEKRQKYKIYVTLENCRGDVQCKWYVQN